MFDPFITAVSTPDYAGHVGWWGLSNLSRNDPCAQAGPKPYTCPVCEGAGQVVVRGTTANKSPYGECPGCRGTCIVWSP